MKVMYIASVFDEECLKKRFGGKPVLSYAASKYNTLLFEGIVKNGVDTEVLSIVPINRNNYKRVIFAGYTTRKENLKVRFLSQINLPVIKNIFNILNGFFGMLFAPKNSILIYDVLVVSASIGAVLGARLRGIKKVGIVTDLPKFQQISQSSFMLKMNERVISASDGYVFLTRQMDDEVNKAHKPYIVLEGHANEEMKFKKHSVFDKDRKRVIYAGAINKIYGIEMLCKAFLEFAQPYEELHIYGQGDYEEELRELEKKHHNIIYHGNRPNEEIVAAELQASLLVNPRPTDGEYTKFSFPSKTLEYMVSGTPVLSSRLEGIPDEYDKYIFFFDDNNYESLGQKMREILDLSVDELSKKGESARNFILEEKNNIVQSAKIIHFCEQLLK